MSHTSSLIVMYHPNADVNIRETVPGMGSGVGVGTGGLVELA